MRGGSHAIARQRLARVVVCPYRRSDGTSFFGNYPNHSRSEIVMAISTGSTRPQRDLLDHPAGSDTNPQLLPAGDGPAGGLGAAARRMPEPEIGYYIAPGTGGHRRAPGGGLL